MHVPDGFINAPVSAATGLLSLGTIWAYIRNAKNLVADRLIALTGMMSALIFVLQMINFPIAAGTIVLGIVPNIPPFIPPNFSIATVTAIATKPANIAEKRVFSPPSTNPRLYSHN